MICETFSSTPQRPTFGPTHCADDRENDGFPRQFILVDRPT